MSAERKIQEIAKKAEKQAQETNLRRRVLHMINVTGGDTLPLEMIDSFRGQIGIAPCVCTAALDDRVWVPGAHFEDLRARIVYNNQLMQRDVVDIGAVQVCACAHSCRLIVATGFTRQLYTD